MDGSGISPITFNDNLMRSTTVLAGLLDRERRPDVPLATGVLDECGRVAEGGEGQGCVVALVYYCFFIN